MTTCGASGGAACTGIGRNCPSLLTVAGAGGGSGCPFESDDASREGTCGFGHSIGGGGSVGDFALGGGAGGGAGLGGSWKAGATSSPPGVAGAEGGLHGVHWQPDELSSDPQIQYP